MYQSGFDESPYGFITEAEFDQIFDESGGGFHVSSTDLVGIIATTFAGILDIPLADLNSGNAYHEAFGDMPEFFQRTSTPHNAMAQWRAQNAAELRKRQWEQDQAKKKAEVKAELKAWTQKHTVPYLREDAKIGNTKGGLPYHLVNDSHYYFNVASDQGGGGRTGAEHGAQWYRIDKGTYDQIAQLSKEGPFNWDEYMADAKRATSGSDAAANGLEYLGVNEVFELSHAWEHEWARTNRNEWFPMDPSSHHANQGLTSNPIAPNVAIFGNKDVIGMQNWLRDNNLGYMMEQKHPGVDLMTGEVGSPAHYRRYEQDGILDLAGRDIGKLIIETNPLTGKIDARLLDGTKITPITNAKQMQNIWDNDDRAHQEIAAKQLKAEQERQRQDAERREKEAARLKAAAEKAAAEKAADAAARQKQYDDFNRQMNKEYIKVKDRAIAENTGRRVGVLGEDGKLSDNFLAFKEQEIAKWQAYDVRTRTENMTAMNRAESQWKERRKDIGLLEEHVLGKMQEKIESGGRVTDKDMRRWISEVPVQQINPSDDRKATITDPFWQKDTNIPVGSDDWATGGRSEREINKKVDNFRDMSEKGAGWRLGDDPDFFYLPDDQRYSKGIPYSSKIWEFESQRNVGNRGIFDGLTEDSESKRDFYSDLLEYTNEVDGLFDTDGDIYKRPHWEVTKGEYSEQVRREYDNFIRNLGGISYALEVSDLYLRLGQSYQDFVNERDARVRKEQLNKQYNDIMDRINEHKKTNTDRPDEDDLRNQAFEEKRAKAKELQYDDKNRFDESATIEHLKKKGYKDQNVINAILALGNMLQSNKDKHTGAKPNTNNTTPTDTVDPTKDLLGNDIDPNDPVNQDTGPNIPVIEGTGEEIERTGGQAGGKGKNYDEAPEPKPPQKIDPNDPTDPNNFDNVDWNQYTGISNFDQILDDLVEETDQNLKNEEDKDLEAWRQHIGDELTRQWLNQNPPNQTTTDDGEGINTNIDGGTVDLPDKPTDDGETPDDGNKLNVGTGILDNPNKPKDPPEEQDPEDYDLTPTIPPTKKLLDDDGNKYDITITGIEEEPPTPPTDEQDFFGGSPMGAGYGLDLEYVDFRKYLSRTNKSYTSAGKGKGYNTLLTR